VAAEEEEVVELGEYYRKRSAELYLQSNRVYGVGRLDLVE
jgi:hypothetical protein